MNAVRLSVEALDPGSGTAFRDGACAETFAPRG